MVWSGASYLKRNNNYGRDDELKRPHIATLKLWTGRDVGKTEQPLGPKLNCQRLPSFTLKFMYTSVTASLKSVSKELAM